MGDNSYKKILYATSIFGGVQVLVVIIGIIKSKFIAVILGSIGFGIIGLLQSSLTLITSLTNFGLRISSVQFLSKLTKIEDEKKISETITIIKRLVWFTGLLGALITWIFSSYISELTFGNLKYSIFFKWLSVTLLLNQISIGQNAILQSFRKINLLAKSTLLGNFSSLIFIIPIYYFYEIDGIIPVFIITSLFTLLFSWYFSQKIKIQKQNVDLQQTLEVSKSILYFGFIISLSTLLTVLVTFLIRVFIGKIGSIEQVGLYTAGFALINSYVGLIFKAISYDYFPRLSSVSNDNPIMINTVNKQAEIMLLILTPVLVLFIIFNKVIILLLYSIEFVEITNMLYLVCCGTFLKAISWSISFVFLSKEDKKIYFWNELFTNIYFLFFSVFGYYYFGLIGVGCAYMLTYTFYLIQVYQISKKRYGFFFSSYFIRILKYSFPSVILIVLVAFCFNDFWLYLIGLMILIFSLKFSFNELEDKVGLKNLINSILKTKIFKK